MVYPWESAVIYVNDKNGPIDFQAIEAALFHCYCLQTLSDWMSSEETSFNEYVMSVMVPVFMDDWKKSRDYFESQFNLQPALKQCHGYWSIIHDGECKWFGTKQ